MKRLHTQSQNFLRSPQTVKTLIGHSTIKKSDVVYDIGAGSGVITSVLAGHCAKVIAIENDHQTANILRKNVETKNNVSIIEDDFLTFDLPADTYKIFANIPFHLSSPIIRKLSGTPHPPTAMYLILQKQFAQKLIIDDRSFTGLLGAFIAPLFTTRIRYKLQKSDFMPAPAVDTVMLELLLRETPLLPHSLMHGYRQFVETCYSRQKYFQSLGVTKKPSELSANEWVTLFQKTSNAKNQR